MSFFHPILILVPFRNDNLVRRDKPTDSVVKILFRLRHKVILEQKNISINKQGQLYRSKVLENKGNILIKIIGQTTKDKRQKLIYREQKR